MRNTFDIRKREANIPYQITQNYLNLEQSYLSLRDWKQRDEEDLWEELVLCILSSNINYETAISAFTHLKDNNLLKYQFLVREKSTEIIAEELSKPIFLPKRKNGLLRKYRFPNVRARNIVHAARVIYYDNEGIFSLLNSFNSEYDVREYLWKHIPGVGLKAASHYLRNIKYSSSLAIIDTHIIAFLEEMDFLDNCLDKSMSLQKYLLYEEIIQEISTYYGYRLPIFDLAIWQYMRSR